MDVKDILREIGLTERESKIYLALLGLGSVTTGPLIKKSEVPNSKIYEVLESLENKGLVSWIVKGKTKYFQAAEPKKILALFKEKERKIESKIPELEFMMKSSEEQKSVEIFEGLRAMRAMFLGLIGDVKKGEDWYGFGTGKDYNEEIKKFYYWWGAIKYNAGLKDHLLISAENKKEFLDKIAKEDLSAVNKITRYSKISFPGDVGIFRDNVVILNWQDNPTAILIKSKNLAEQYKGFFLGLWGNSK